MVTCNGENIIIDQYQMASSMILHLHNSSMVQVHKKITADYLKKKKFVCRNRHEARRRPDGRNVATATKKL